MLEIRLLGTFDIRRGQKPVILTSRPAQSLFAYLVLNAGTAFRREKLAGLLWPDTTEESARDYLRHALWRIRKALKSASSVAYLRADDLTIAFDTAPDCWLDVDAIRDAEEAGPLKRLAEALAAYRGELLPGFYEEWVLLEREHVQAIFEGKLGHLLERLQLERRWAEIQHWAEKWIAFGQRPEAAYRSLMLAYARQGDMAKAVEAYDRCARALAELGLEPSEQTRRLLEEVKSGTLEIRMEQQAAGRVSQKRTSARLPIPLTGFIGREKELLEILRLLREKRLVTLIGPGGVGKTRLAIEAAQRLHDKPKNEVIWVDLVGLTDPALIPQAILQAAGIPDTPSRSIIDSLVERFSAQRTLLILDNCEHLIAGCARTAATLLAETEQLRILATSREALDILGETAWTVPSLSLPPQGEGRSAGEVVKSESARLFLERLAAAYPPFELTDQNAGAVAQVCHRLGGIPLALELAAARARMMSVDEIARRLDRSFDLLSAGNRGALPRHQTLRAAIDWSYELLTEPERILFRRLAVFAGGFTLEAAEAVASGHGITPSEATELLGQLINKSLVMTQARSLDATGETRYGLLETIRQYALAKLEEAAEVSALRDRHLTFFADFARRAEKGMYSPLQAEWFKRSNEDADNFRAALDSPAPAAVGPDAPGALDYGRHYVIVSSLAMFWERGYRREITQVLKRLLELDTGGALTKERAKALCTGGFLHWSLYDFELAQQYLAQSIGMAEELGDQLTLAWALGYLGWTLDSLGEYDKAQGLLERSLSLARTLGEAGSHAAASAMSFLGDIPYWRGDLVEARRLYEESITFTRRLQNKNTLTYPLRRLGYVAVHQGEWVEAAALFGESLDLNQQLEHVPGITACLAGFAALELEQGRFEKAARLCGCVEALLDRFGAPFFMGDRLEYQRSASRLKQAYGEAKLSRAWKEGGGLRLDEGVRLALSAPGRGTSRSIRSKNIRNTR